MTDKNMPIDLVLHTPGGLVPESMPLCRHSAKTRVIIPRHAMSGGTFIALAADEILMDPFADLGPLDPQIGSNPAVSILNVLELKEVSEIDDATLIQADIPRKAIPQVHESVEKLLQEKMTPEKSEAAASKLTKSVRTHDYPMICQEALEMGLPISCEIPKEFYQLMNLDPQPVRSALNVDYIPRPYFRQKNGGR